MHSDEERIHKKNHKNKCSSRYAFTIILAGLALNATLWNNIDKYMVQFE